MTEVASELGVTTEALRLWKKAFLAQFNPDSKAGRQMEAVLKPSQWIKLIDRLGEIDNPTVREQPSKYAITVKPPERASSAHAGE